jgi:hypothetical protein
MLFRGRSKVNKLVLLKRELHPVSLCLFKTALVNLAKRSTVMLCALTVNQLIPFCVKESYSKKKSL